MSFILNALRKSEQERRNLESETVTDKILLIQPQQKRNKTAIFFGLLLIGNVFVVAGIVWFIKNNSVATPELTATSIAPAIAVPEKKVQVKAVTKPSQPERLTQKTETKTTSIAELIDTQKPVVAPLPVKPVITKTPVIDVSKPPVIAKKPELPVPVVPNIEVIEQVEPVAPEMVPVKKAIPFLTELPVEFRQALPKFNINVFVYSQHPEERFVMIDMVKYKPGQQIKDTLLLKEILPGSLLVVYQGQEFQMARP